MKQLFLLCCILPALHIKAQVLLPDSAFGINGVQTFDRASGNSGIFDVEIQNNGNIISAGFIRNLNEDLFITSHLTSGQPDVGFGNFGKIHIDLGGDESVNDMALQTDGKIILCGFKTQTGQVSKFILMRLLKNGSPDNSFGDKGTVVFSAINGISTTGAVFRNVRIQTDGRIIVAGYVFVSNEYRGIVQRYQTNGKLDSSFGTNGSAFVKFTAGSHNYAESIHIRPDGKILVLGSAYASSFGHRLMRLKANGSIDSSFGSNGTSANTFSGFSNITPEWISELPDGRILTAGYAYNGTLQKVYVSRHLVSGGPDLTFGTNGFSSFATTSGNNYAYDAFLHNNGDCSIPTESFNSTGSVACVIRIDSLGNPSAGFGINGISTFTLADEVYGNAIAVVKDSLVLVGGMHDNKQRFYQGYVAKIDPAGNLVQGFASAGIGKTGSGRSASTSVNIIPASAGSIYITGTQDNMNKDQVVAKINPDGETVNAFGQDGFAYFDLDKDEELVHATKLADESILMLSRTGRQNISFTAPVVTLTGPTHYSLSVIDAGGSAKTSLQKNFTFTSGQFPSAKVVRQDNNGRFIVLASSAQAVITDFFLVRHQSDLSMDNSYGNSGKIAMQGRTTSNFTALGDIQVAPDNDVVVLNWFSNTVLKPFSNFTIKKYKENGTLDQSFASFGTFTNTDTVGKDPSSASHLWKFSNGYYVDYYKDGIAKIVHIGFSGSVSSFGTAALDSVTVADMKQLPDSSFLILCYKGPEARIYHYFANGTRDQSFNSNGLFKSTPFEDSKIVKGFTVNADQSVIIYHQIEPETNPAYMGLSKFTLRQTGPTSISTLNTIEVSLYPNPFSSGIFLELTHTESMASDFRFTLTDINGRDLPIRIELISGNTMYIESKSDIPPGIYILNGKNNHNEFIQKKLIKH